ncbi:MAG: YfhO family protein [Ignavibacteriales bacterium]|nr:YfhO family protein [Ignavibacteriales bacterium]
MTKGKTKTSIGMPHIKDWHAVIIICSLVAIFFRDILLQKAFFWDDFLYQYYPYRNFSAVSLSGGELPLWNPYTFSGSPFQADIQSAVFYIPNLILTLFVAGGKLNFYWLEIQIIIHMMIAGVSIYFLAKEFGLLNFAALFTGVIFSLSGFMISHVIHHTIICHIAWLPLIILLFRRAVLQHSLITMILGGMVLGNVILAGSPQVSLYIMFFLLIYFIFELLNGWKENSISGSVKKSSIAIGFVIIALAFTAIQLLPTIELAPLSQRAEITYEKSQEGQLVWQQLITFIIPKYFGSSGAEGSTYWGNGAYWVYWETCFYLGIPAFILIIFSMTRFRANRYIIFFFSIGIFSVLYALGDNFILHNFFFHYIPGFDKFRSVGRIMLISAFSFSLLAGFGIQAMFDLINQSPQKFKKILIGIGAIVIILFLLSLAGWMQGGVDRRVADQIHANTVEASTSMLLISLTSVGLIFLISRRFSAFIMLGALLIVLFIDINLFGFNHNNGTTNPDEYYRRTESLVRSLREAGQQEYFRVNSRRENTMILDRNQGMIDRIFMMEGYTPLSLQRNYPIVKDFDRACDLLNAKYQLVVDESRRLMDLVPSKTYLPRVFFVYDSKIITNEDSARAYMIRDEFNPRSTAVFERDPQFTVDGISGDGKAVITSYSLNKISVQAETPKNGLLILSEIFYPGWNAYIDGTLTPIHRVDWCLRAIPVKSGRHEIVLRFEPESFRIGSLITFSTLLISVVSILFIQIKKKK